MLTEEKYLQQLESAALAGDLEEVDRLTSDENRINVNNFNVIKKVISAGQLEAAKLIFNRGGEFDIKSELTKNMEIIHSIIVTGDFKLLKMLVYGTFFSLKDPDKDGIPPIFKVVHISSDVKVYSKFLDFLLSNETKREGINTINAKYQTRSFTILHYAAEMGNATIIPVLLSRKCQLNTKSGDGLTALHVAAKNRHSHVVQKLLESGAKDNLLTNNQLTALHFAVENGDCETFRILLKHFIDSGTSMTQYFQKEVNQSLLYLATSKGHKQIVSSLLSYEAVLNYSDRETGQTALHFAVKSENVQIIQLLLKHDAKLDILDKNGFSPLHVACTTGNLQIILMILNEKKCKINVKTDKGLTALHLAVKQGHFEVVSLLLKRMTKYNEFDNSQKTPLSFALENTSGDGRILILLLKHIRQEENKENNATLLTEEDHLLIKYHTEVRNDKNGSSVLHLAVEKEDETAIHLFLKHRACLDILNKNGYTPFDLATVNGSFAAVNVFLKSRPDPKTLFVPSGEDGFTPMHYAVEEGNTDMLEVFFKAGISADLHYKIADSFSSSEPNGLTPLHIAVRKGDTNLIHLLLKNGAKVDVVGRADFETPLFTAAENGNTEVLEILSEASTLRSSKWKEGYLPMCIAAYRGHENFVKMLLDKGGDPNSTRSRYLSPLHAAATQGHEKIVRLLLERGAWINPKRFFEEFVSTPLLNAFFAKHTRIVQLLLKQGADFNAQILCVEKNDHFCGTPITNPSVLMTERILKFGDYTDSEIGEEGSLIGYRPLHFAVEEGNKALVKSLINSGVNVNFKTKSGATAIGLAIEKASEPMIKLLFAAGANILNSHKNKSIFDIEVLKTNVKIAEIVVKYVSSSHQNLDGASVTPLGIAVENELEACVEKLLRAGASLRVDHNEQSLLYTAVRKRNSTIVKILLKYGSDANCLGKFRDLAIHVATNNEDAHIVKLLLDAGANKKIYDALCKAIVNDNATIVEMFLKRGFIDFNHETESPYRFALEVSTPEVVQKFLDCKASTDKDNKKGEDPIFYAIEDNNLEVVQLLLKAGTSANCKTNKGEPLLHFLISKHNSNDKLYQILVDHGVDLNTPNKKKQSPLTRILRWKKENKFENQGSSLLKLLLVNGVKNQGSSVLKLFLVNGVDANVLDMADEGKTMLELAIENENSSDLKVLLLNGADINFMNLKKKIPLEVAVEKALKVSMDYEAKRTFTNQQNNSKNLENLNYDTYYVGLVNTFWSRRIVRLLVQEVARREAAKMEVNEENISVVSSPYVKEYYGECKKEIDSMKMLEICHGISYFDILVGNINNLGSYARHSQVKRILLSEKKLAELFPNYEHILVHLITLGRDRRHFLDICCQHFKGFLHYNFPLLVVEHIFSFLKNNDLRKLYTVIEMCSN